MTMMSLSPSVESGVHAAGRMAMLTLALLIFYVRDLINIQIEKNFKLEDFLPASVLLLTGTILTRRLPAASRSTSVISNQVQLPLEGSEHQP